MRGCGCACCVPRCWPAITVAGTLGVPSSNRRISGSKLSIADPTAAVSYFGGPDEANAAATVFREIPNCLAIARPDNRSDRCSRRISAQSATVITLLIVEEWLTSQPQHVAQYSTADDTLGPGQAGLYRDSLWIPKQRCSRALPCRPLCQEEACPAEFVEQLV